MVLLQEGQSSGVSVRGSGARGSGARDRPVGAVRGVLGTQGQNRRRPHSGRGGAGRERQPSIGLIAFRAKTGLKSGPICQNFGKKSAEKSRAKCVPACAATSRRCAERRRLQPRRKVARHRDGGGQGDDAARTGTGAGRRGRLLQSRRWRELGMSIFWRYLVTVRRATTSPLLLQLFDQLIVGKRVRLVFLIDDLLQADADDVPGDSEKHERDRLMHNLTEEANWVLPLRRLGSGVRSFPLTLLRSSCLCDTASGHAAHFNL